VLTTFVKTNLKRKIRLTYKYSREDSA